MEHFDWNEKDIELIRRAKSILANARDERDPSRQTAFSQTVLARARQEETRPGGMKRSYRKYAYIAAAVFTGILGVMAMMTDMFRPSPPELRSVRLEAEKTPLPLDSLTIERADLIGDIEGETLVLLAYDHHGERCLWLYPQRLIRSSGDPEANAEFEKKKKWYTTVTEGRMVVPREAVLDSFDANQTLIIMRIDKHFEIWAPEALERYFKRTAGKRS